MVRLDALLLVHQLLRLHPSHWMYQQQLLHLQVGLLLVDHLGLQFALLLLLLLGFRPIQSLLLLHEAAHPHQQGLLLPMNQAAHPHQMPLEDATSVMEAGVVERSPATPAMAAHHELK